MTVRILLVEDAEINRCLFQDFLEAQGYIVHGLSDGIALFEAIDEFNPHLILLDLKLPQIDGFTLLQQLQQSLYNSIPVVVISAHGFQREKLKAFSLGARSYLTKPVALEELLQTIKLELAREVT